MIASAALSKRALSMFGRVFPRTSMIAQAIAFNLFLAFFPTLLIAGRHDPCIPYRHAVHAHRKLSKSRLQVIDSGHFPQQDSPGSIAQLLKDFLFSTADELFSANPLKTGNRPAERASGTRYMTMA